MNRLKVCKKCRVYTLKDICKVCGETTVSPHPPRFSPQDPYGEYRRKLKREIMKEEGNGDEGI